MPLSTTIHNVEITLGRGGFVTKLIVKGGRLATLRLPFGDVCMISQDCLTIISQVGHIDANNQLIGKAGSKRCGSNLFFLLIKKVVAQIFFNFFGNEPF